MLKGKTYPHRLAVLFLAQDKSNSSADQQILSLTGVQGVHFNLADQRTAGVEHFSDYCKPGMHAGILVYSAHKDLEPIGVSAYQEIRLLNALDESLRKDKSYLPPELRGRND